MLAIISFALLGIIALYIVSTINRIQKKERSKRLQQRKLKIQADALKDVIDCLEHTIATNLIAKLINDEMIRLLKSSKELDKKPNPAIENNLKQAEARSEKLIDEFINSKATYLKVTDSSISNTKTHLIDAIKMLRHLHAENTISETDLSSFEAELSWAYLMVGITADLRQGQKLLGLGDKFLSRELFEKALTSLKNSTNKDARKLQMITEVKEILEGNRQEITEDLLAEPSAVNYSADY